MKFSQIHIGDFLACLDEISACSKRTISLKVIRLRAEGKAMIKIIKPIYSVDRSYKKILTLTIICFNNSPPTILLASRCLINL